MKEEKYKKKTQTKSNAEKKWSNHVGGHFLSSLISYFSIFGGAHDVFLLLLCCCCCCRWWLWWFQCMCDIVLVEFLCRRLTTGHEHALIVRCSINVRSFVITFISSTIINANKLYRWTLCVVRHWLWATVHTDFSIRPSIRHPQIHAHTPTRASVYIYIQTRQRKKITTNQITVGAFFSFCHFLLKYGAYLKVFRWMPSLVVMCMLLLLTLIM